MSDPMHSETSPGVPEFMDELHDLTSNLRSALERFRFDARLNDLAEKEMPDARQRLSHVLKLTSEAAHRTLDLVEQTCPPAERNAREAGELLDLWACFRARQISPEDFRSLMERMDVFLPTVRTDFDAVRANLNEVLLAQGYQDLSGQIIRSVMTLVSEVEKTLAELTRLARGDSTATMDCEIGSTTRAAGPAVPGVDAGTAVVNDQQDVDALLSDLGM
jgi:chemotaxis protein CheZ